MQGTSLVRDPFLELWIELPNWFFFYIFFVIWRASSTSVMSSAIVAEMRLTWLTNSVLEETRVCRDLSVRTAADANSFADDPSRDLRYWWFFTSLARLRRSRLWDELLELVEELVLGSGASNVWIPGGDETLEILSCLAPSPAHTCREVFLLDPAAAFPKIEPVAWLEDLAWLGSWVVCLALCRTQFLTQLRRKSIEEVGGGVGSGLGSGGSMMTQLDSYPQSVSESDCSHTQGPGGGEVEDGWPANNLDPRHTGFVHCPLPLEDWFDPDAPSPEYTPRQIVEPIPLVSSSSCLGNVGVSNGDFWPSLDSREGARESWGRWALPIRFTGGFLWSEIHCFRWGWWGPWTPLDMIPPEYSCRLRTDSSLELAACNPRWGLLGIGRIG